MGLLARCLIWLKIVDNGTTIPFPEMLMGWMLTLPFYSITGPMKVWFLWSCVFQLVVFLFCGIPAILTGQMVYVDLGCRLGQAMIGVHAVLWGGGVLWRRIVICGIFLVYMGWRASIALYVLFPWRFPEDMPRYQYSKSRFMHEQHSTEGLWRIKIAHDMFQLLWLLNVCVIGTQLMLISFSNNPWPYFLEVVGFILFCYFWRLSFRAENQRMLFMKNKPPGAKSAVLGMAPYDGPDYSLWSRSRHPNLFTEWATISSFTVIAFPSIVEAGLPGWLKTCILLTQVFGIRLLYDWYVFIMGAEPTEYFQVKKHHNAYTKYQKKVRLFFPFELPRVNHGRLAFWPRRTEGWPHAPTKKNKFLQLPEIGEEGVGYNGAESAPVAVLTSLPSIMSLDSDLADI